MNPRATFTGFRIRQPASVRYEPFLLCLRLDIQTFTAPGEQEPDQRHSWLNHKGAGRTSIRCSCSSCCSPHYRPNASLLLSSSARLQASTKTRPKQRQRHRIRIGTTVHIHALFVDALHAVSVSTTGAVIGSQDDNACTDSAKPTSKPCLGAASAHTGMSYKRLL